MNSRDGSCRDLSRPPEPALDTGRRKGFFSLSRFFFSSWLYWPANAMRLHLIRSSSLRSSRFVRGLLESPLMHKPQLPPAARY